MAIELKVPSAGESITEVVIVEWLKGEGVHAKRDEPLALIETDKANVEVMAPESGTVSRIMKKAGESAKVGEVIALFEPGEGKTVTTPQGEQAKQQAKKEAHDKIVEAPAAQRADGGAMQLRDTTPPAKAATTNVDQARATPSARRAMREGHSAPTDGVSAPNGAGDLAGARALTSREGASPILDGRGADTKKDPRERVVPMTPMRKRVAERLLEAQQSAALLTTFNEVDMTNVMALRKQHQDAFKERHGVKLGFMSFFVKGAVEALRAFPAINAEIRGTDIIYRDYADIGVAVGGGKGLVVPVLRGAERLSFADVERAIGDFGERAKTGRLRVEELQNGTFTISNGGVYGSLMSTPIVNPPQSGILGMHAIQERPIARAGQMVIAPMMYVALTYDHRIVDGREAVGFLVRIKECVENPTRLLLEV